MVQIKVHLSQHNRGSPTTSTTCEDRREILNNRQHGVIQNERKTNHNNSHNENIATASGGGDLHWEVELSREEGCAPSRNDDIMPVMLTQNAAAWFVESWIVEYAIAYQHMSVVQS